MCQMLNIFKIIYMTILTQFLDKMKKSREKAAPDLSSLLVFGYACKLFRDDSKALSLESGDHLIPWMGDSSIKIDR